MSPDMSDIVAALTDVRQRIAGALRRAQRPEGATRLVAVSKKVSTDRIRAAMAAGQLDFGESYGQELRDKLKELASSAETVPVWHYIGPLQSNKVKYVAGRVHLIHSIDSPEILMEVDRHVAKLIAGGELPAQAVQTCLVQVNVAGEQQKHGIPPEALTGMLDRFDELEHVRCAGLMLIPPLTESADASRPLFAELTRLREVHAAKPRRHVELRELSMGMSDDFEVAAEEGATLVRVGSAIFGART